MWPSFLGLCTSPLHFQRFCCAQTGDIPMSLHVNDRHGTFVAMLIEQPKCADGYRAHEPWLLRYKEGRIDRFPLQSEAKAEAKKTWINCTFEQTAH